MKKFIMVIVGLLAAAYLANPGLGVFAEIPDNFPIIGNLDEAAVTAILLSVLSYFGIDLTSLMGKKPKKKNTDKPIDIN